MAELNHIDRKRLLAILGPNIELYSLSYANIFTIEKEGTCWLDSGIEGFLCFYYDRKEKLRFFTLFNKNTYDKLFYLELFINFHQYYTVLSNKFHCLELNQGFIGFKHICENESSKFAESVQKFSSDNTIGGSNNYILNKTKDIIDLLKKKYGSNLKTAFTIKSEYYGNNGMDIYMPKHYEYFNNINYEHKIQKFVIGDLPNNLKKLFIYMGLENPFLKDNGYDLEIFNIITQLLDNVQKENREKVSKMYKKGGNLLLEKEEKNTKKTSKSIFDNRRDFFHKVSTNESRKSLFIPLNSNFIDKIKPISNHSAKLSVPNIPNIPNIPIVPIIPKVPNLPINDKSTLKVTEYKIPHKIQEIKVNLNKTSNWKPLIVFKIKLVRLC